MSLKDDSRYELLTAEELAEKFRISVEKLHELRKRRGWPCVRFGRYDFRFTEAQVAQIIAMHTEAPREQATTVLSGLTPRSAARIQSR